MYLHMNSNLLSQLRQSLYLKLSVDEFKGISFHSATSFILIVTLSFSDTEETFKKAMCYRPATTTIILHLSTIAPANKIIRKKIDVAKTTGLQLLEAFHFTSV